MANTGRQRHGRNMTKKPNTATEIEETRWGDFCERLQEFGRDSMSSVEVAQPDGARSTVVHSAPLTSFYLDTKGGCSNTLVIEAGAPATRPVRHIVVQPIHIRLQTGKDRKRFNRVHILAENGITVLTLHPGIAPSAFRGLEVMDQRGARNQSSRAAGLPSGQNKRRVGSKALGSQTRTARAAGQAMTRTRRNVDLDYAQGDLEETRRLPVAPPSKRERKRRKSS